MKITIFIAIMFLLSISNINAQSFCDKINEIQEYQDSAGTINTKGLRVVDTATFAIDDYLALFDKLSYDPRKNIDVWYMSSGAGGYPRLYAIDKNDELNFLICKIKIKPKKASNDDFMEIYEFMMDSSSFVENYITPEDSEEGFLQYLFILQMGEHFALFWHAYYNEAYIICNQEQVDNAIGFLRGNKDFATNDEDLENFSQISPEPEIVKKADNYTISWIEYWTHNGIYRRTYKIDRNPPYKVSLIEEELLVPITISFMY